MGKTIAEKIIEAHYIDNPSDDIYVVRLDAVFCHEITTPVAINDTLYVSTSYTTWALMAPEATATSPSSSGARARRRTTWTKYLLLN